MSPSEMITDGQVAKFIELLRAGLRKSGLARTPTQLILEHQGKELVNDVLDNLLHRVEEINRVVVFRVRADHTRDPRELLDAAGLNVWADSEVHAEAVKTLPAMPYGDIDVEFFNVGGTHTNEAVGQEYARRGLVPANPFTLAQVNIDHPHFADGHPNCTYWKNATGRWFFAAIDRPLYMKRASIGRQTFHWGSKWWFAGVKATARQQTTLGPLTAQEFVLQRYPDAYVDDNGEWVRIRVRSFVTEDCSQCRQPYVHELMTDAQKCLGGAGSAYYAWQDAATDLARREHVA